MPDFVKDEFEALLECGFWPMGSYACVIQQAAPTPTALACMPLGALRHESAQGTEAPVTLHYATGNCQ
ncbi:MAG TPA: hypothetical protein PKG49_12060 [Nitrosomonas mobilis]|nr:hypothetical protein [Nitrosomonas mobilis]HNO76299.1 hypothetical protein [Nitrosomonas mobilis]